MKIKLFLLMLLGVTVFTGCSKDDDNEAPDEKITSGATKSITVVFAPGQLGDMGFADNVLEGVFRLKVLDHQAQPDTLDVSYLAGEDLDAIKELTENWFDEAFNPYTAKLYQHRLLVLTEPYMVDWVEPMKERFNEWDEVLVLKMNKDDVQAAAERLGLGNRLHGLNISAASSARRYCKLISRAIEDAIEDQEQDAQDGDNEGDEMADDEDLILNCNEVYFYRLYNSEQVTYRDSIAEVMEEKLDDMADIVTKSVAEKAGEAIYTEDGETTILQMAYLFGQEMTDMYRESRYGFHVADLGSAAQGLSYYFMGRDNRDVHVLMLDTQASNQLCVRRDFGTALYNWGARWMRADHVGAMPAIEEFGDWNSNYVTDNIELDEDDK